MTLYKRKQNIVKLKLNTDGKNFLFSYRNVKTRGRKKSKIAEQSSYKKSNTVLVSYDTDTQILLTREVDFVTYFIPVLTL